MKPGKPTLYAYGTVTEREEYNQLTKISIEVRFPQGETSSFSVMAGKKSSDWLEVGTLVSIRLRVKQPSATAVDS